ncbi:MAG: hypothetical protein RL468_2764, partial [Pseudomonadota bacterium]
MKPIAITQGDAAGIGPEIIVKAYRDSAQRMRGCFIVGSSAVIRRASALLAGAGAPAMPLAVIESPAEVMDLPAGCLPVLALGEEVDPAPWGRVSAAAGRQAGACVVWAARAALRGEIAALVTAPLNKEALSAAGPPYDNFPGHTELLQSEAASYFGKTVAELPVRMMLANDELRTVLLSIHVSLREAIEAVTVDNLMQTLRIARTALGQMLNRPPRLAVAGLNPHAGEGGQMGDEEIRILGPAIQMAQKEGLQVSGPLPSDTVFLQALDSDRHPERFDAVVVMYHDQGLIPIKLLGFDEGVNVTLGLPLRRTSPDHG